MRERCGFEVGWYMTSPAPPGGGEEAGQDGVEARLVVRQAATPTQHTATPHPSTTPPRI